MEVSQNDLEFGFVHLTATNPVVDSVISLSTLSLHINFLYASAANQEPLFRQGITDIGDLKLRETLSGKVSNVTHFGAFLDVGLKKDVLLHISQMNGNVLKFGDKVIVTIIAIDMNKNRVGVTFKSFM